MGWLFESEKERMPSLKIHRIREIRFGHAEKNAYMVVNTLLAMSRGLSLAVLRAFTWSLCNLGWKGAGDRAAISPFIYGQGMSEGAKKNCILEIRTFCRIQT